jgi:hypothetical protein
VIRTCDHLKGRDPITFPVQQCIHNQAGFIAEVRWFKDGTLTFVQKQGEDEFKITPSAPPISDRENSSWPKELRRRRGEQELGGSSPLRGARPLELSRSALDVAAVGVFAGCVVGAAALSVAAPGGGSRRCRQSVQLGSEARRSK